MPAKLLDALAHAGDAHTASTAHHVLARSARDAGAVILDLQQERAGVTLRCNRMRAV
jgi:hypothetical protein